MAFDLSWVLTDEEGLDGRFKVSLKGFGASGEFGDAGDVFVGANLDYDSAGYQGVKSTQVIFI